MLLRRLSVFAGGFTLAGAEAVCRGAGLERGEVLDVLAHLVDKSMVAVREQAGEARYGLLDTMRLYGQERLAESGDQARLVRRQHASFFLVLAARAEPKLNSADRRAWLERLEAEHDNLRAALRWSLTSGA